jgi:hypothetical protein
MTYSYVNALAEMNKEERQAWMDRMMQDAFERCGRDGMVYYVLGVFEAVLDVDAHLSKYDDADDKTP